MTVQPATIKLGYWTMRGYGEPIRNLLRYAQVPFEDIRYGFGEAPNFNWKEWLEQKPKVGLDFPNLPYLIDGDLKINQSQAILRYLGGKYGLRATDLTAQAREDMIEQEIVDLRDRFVHAAYHTKYNSDQDLENEMKLLRADIAAHLVQLERWIANKQWLTGDRLSFVDFIAYEYLDWYRDFVQADCLEPFPQMSAYMKRFEQLPQLSEHLSSDAYRKAPILNPTRTKFGYYR